MAVEAQQAPWECCMQADSQTQAGPASGQGFGMHWQPLGPGKPGEESSQVMRIWPVGQLAGQPPDPVPDPLPDPVPVPLPVPLPEPVPQLTGWQVQRFDGLNVWHVHAWVSGVVDPQWKTVPEQVAPR